MALQFVKVGQHMRAKVQIILGTRIGEESAAPGDIVDVLATDAWTLIAQGKAKAYESLPGLEPRTNVAPVATPVPEPQPAPKPEPPPEVKPETQPDALASAKKGKPDAK